MIDDNGGDVPAMPNPAAAAGICSQQALML
jgi:hypothetical protein